MMQLSCISYWLMPLLRYAILEVNWPGCQIGEEDRVTPVTTNEGTYLLADRNFERGEINAMSCLPNIGRETITTWQNRKLDIDA